MMVVPVLETAVLTSKFRGCLLGSLLGDCFGAPFENEGTHTSPANLQRYFDEMEDPNFRSPVKKYTDDTAMTKSVGESLAQHDAFNEKDMASRFMTEYFQNPRRGYGQAVGALFKKWKDSKLEDVWKPAREQFQGEGSAGNGAAMRISPVGLYCYRDRQLLIHTATQCSKLTHVHRLGVHGAILQALAIQQCVFQNPQDPIDANKFTTDLLDKISEIEPDDEKELCDMDNEPKSYQIQLMLMRELLDKETVEIEEVVDILGNDVLAIYSVPTAIYCFLKALKPINGIETDSPFRRAVQYAIMIGGDTDTIASMAGALAGAYMGDESINSNLLKHCEAADYITTLAETLLDVVNSP